MNIVKGLKLSFHSEGAEFSFKIKNFKGTVSQDFLNPFLVKKISTWATYEQAETGL